MTRDDRPPATLDDALRQLAAAIDVPPAPDYAERVIAHLERQTTPRSRIPGLAGVSGVRRLLLAAAVVLVTTSVLVAVPGTRHALASWFGFSGIKIHSEPGPSITLPTTPAPLAAGRPVTMTEARHAAANRIALPRHLPAPAQVYLRRDGKALIVTFAYRTAPVLKPTPETGYALVVTEIFDSGYPVLEKILHTGAAAEPVRIHGNAGVFIDGPQEIINIDNSPTSQGSGVVHEVPPRASANTLIWNDSAATYRIEGTFTRTTAVSLATTFA